METATAAGYAPNFGCVTHPEHGAMGIHYINGDLLSDPAIDPLRPETVMYEPQTDGSMQAIGIEYVVLQDAWLAAGNQTPPSLLGQEFKLTTGFFDVPPFYALQIWLWKENPAGMFTGYNPAVVCPAALATFPGGSGAPTAPQQLPATGEDADHRPLLWVALLALSLAAAVRLAMRSQRRSWTSKSSR